MKAVKKDHQNLQVSDSELFINSTWLHIGASPDGIVQCDRCVKQVLEVKCPYNHRDNSIKDTIASDGQFCLIKQDDSYHLNQSHAYYAIFAC